VGNIQANRPESLRCKSCGVEQPTGRPLEPCGCGSAVLVLTVSDAVGPVYDDAHIRAMDPAKTGKKKRVFDQKVGVEHHHDSDRFQYRDRRFNFVADQYDEVITDLETGEIVREVHEPLSDHRHRGSARRPLDDSASEV
jgi:hypothetical protein